MAEQSGADSIQLSLNEIAGSVQLNRSGSIMILDFDLASPGPIEIVASFADRDVWFNGFAQLESSGTTIAAAPHLTLSFPVQVLSVAPLGDYDGDGFDDFAVGCPGHTVDDVAVGAVHFFRGGLSLADTPAFTFLGRQHWENFGTVMQLGGDIDGDGQRDLLVLARSFDGNDVNSGRLDVLYLDATTGISGRTSIFGEGTNSIMLMDGDADIDLDGIPDVVTASDIRSEAPLCMFSGAALAAVESVDLSQADGRYDQTASGLGSIGDINGDGLREVVTGNGWDTSRGGGRCAVLAGGHRVLPRFRLDDAVANAGEVVTLTLYGTVETTDPGATLDLAALDLSLDFDDDRLDFLDAAAADWSRPLFHAAAASYGTLKIAVATHEPMILTETEQPLLTLHFRAGDTPGEVPFLLDTIDGHSSLDLPLWPQFSAGSVTISATMSVPLPALRASVRAHPNPFNPRTTISWMSPTPGPVSLRLHDARGRLVWREDIPAASIGPHTTAWDGRDGHGRAMASGIYLLRVKGDTWSATTRLTLVR